MVVMSILRNTTAGISYPLLSYQRALLDRLQSGGSLPGEMSIITSGRQIGKSYLNALYSRVNPCNEISIPIGKVTKAKYKFTRANWYRVDQVSTLQVNWCV